jgi:hypothetical protein
MAPMRMILAGWLALAFALLVLAPVPASATSAAVPAPAPGSRAVTRLDAHWLFLRSDEPGAERPEHDDSKWTRVTLPHSFNAGDGEQQGYYRGLTWYRRTFHVARPRSDRRSFVQFDGAATVADVYLNGKRIGRHEGGHAAFRFDLTEALAGGRNILAVRVDNSPNRAVTPLGGDFTLFGGLYRPVWLIETDELHLDLLDHGGPGVYVRSEQPRNGATALKVRARVANDGARARRVPVRITVLDALGAEVGRGSTRIAIPPRSTRTAEVDATVVQPHLWDGVRDPYLYRVSIQLGDEGDAIALPFGIRSARIDPKQGFLLNGRPYPLRGANLMHSARPGKGTAVSEAEIAEDFAILREMGSTGVRLVHFQHGQPAYDEADRIGLPLWTEIGINSEIEDTPAFRANAEQQLRELIAQTFNHPSVVMWGLGNEVYSEDPSVARILAELHRLARELDPSRPTVYAHCCQADDHPKAMVSDVIGFNRYFGWYPDQAGTTIGRWAEGFHRAHPERAFAVSEYGAGASIVHQEDPPRPVVPASGWHPEQFQSLYHERNWLELADKPYLFGTFVWVAFDLASAGRHEGDRRGINDKGLVTYDRQVRKDAFHWYKAHWSEQPMLYITSRRFTLRHEAEAEVKVYTNLPRARLVLNGTEIGTRDAVDRMVRWNVRLAEGENRIEVRAASGDDEISDRIEWTFRPTPAVLDAGKTP